MDQWLVRTTQNLLAGPYTRDQVCQLIREGQLGLQDEVCPANGYWMFLHESEEIARTLGIELPHAPGSSDEEITETETDAGGRGEATPQVVSDFGTGEEGAPEQTAILSLGAVSAGAPSVAASAPAAAPEQEPEHEEDELMPRLEQIMPAGQGSARISSISTGPRLERPQTLLPPIERPSVWRGVIWLMITAALLIVWAVLRLTRNA